MEHKCFTFSDAVLSRLALIRTSSVKFHWSFHKHLINTPTEAKQKYIISYTGNCVFVYLSSLDQQVAKVLRANLWLEFIEATFQGQADYS